MLSCSIQLAFTACIFRDCNIDKLEPDEALGFCVFDRPLEQRRTDFEIRLGPSAGRAQGKGKMSCLCIHNSFRSFGRLR
jgi:hypothetical protein